MNLSSFSKQDKNPPDLYAAQYVVQEKLAINKVFMSTGQTATYKTAS
jgi:hypothetical protein